ncbi:hypothetical protein LCGC14_1586810 [marine sediment metagenome]|uniref:Uncharacterized protein n=1 Tax=marine sediment metagenome TaxID=412755 RepID=A0A0F9LFK8_9ZZZZ
MSIQKMTFEEILRSKFRHHAVFFGRVQCPCCGATVAEMPIEEWVKLENYRKMRHEEYLRKHKLAKDMDVRNEDDPNEH